MTEHKSPPFAIGDRHDGPHLTAPDSLDHAALWGRTRDGMREAPTAIKIHDGGLLHTIKIGEQTMVIDEFHRVPAAVQPPQPVPHPLDVPAELARCGLQAIGLDPAKLTRVDDYIDGVAALKMFGTYLYRNTVVSAEDPREIGKWVVEVTATSPGDAQSPGDLEAAIVHVGDSPRLAVEFALRMLAAAAVTNALDAWLEAEAASTKVTDPTP